MIRDGEQTYSLNLFLSPRFLQYERSLCCCGKDNDTATVPSCILLPPEKQYIVDNLAIAKTLSATSHWFMLMARINIDVPTTQPCSFVLHALEKRDFFRHWKSDFVWYDSNFFLKKCRILEWELCYCWYGWFVRIHSCVHETRASLQHSFFLIFIWMRFTSVSFQCSSRTNAYISTLK